MRLDFETIETYCLQKKGTTKSFPFGEGTPVFKVLRKMYVLGSEESSLISLNLKVDPDDSLALQKQYPAIIPGYHMNKRHWITAKLDGSIPDQLLFELIDGSYDLVVSGLTLVEKQSLGY